MVQLVGYISNALIHVMLSDWKPKKGFRDNVPLIATLCNPGIRDRHWKQMSDICGFDITPDPFTTLRKMQKMDLDQHMEQFEAISGGATKEFSLEKALAKMQEEWEPIEVIIIIIIYTGARQ